MSADHTPRNVQLFDAVAGTYDQLGFLTLAAGFLAAQVPVTPGAEVLDVATGTGTAALLLADRGAAVTGVDLSARMVDVARQRAGGRAVSFLLADGAALPFADGKFDTVVCAAGLFFLPDMPGALREWRRVLRPGGQVVVSSFGRGLLGTFPALWREELAALGMKPGAPPLGRIPTPEAARALLEEAGFRDVQVTLDALPYVLRSPEARWADVTAGLEGAVLAAFPPEERAALRDAHLRRLRGAFPAWPVEVPVPVIVARGRT